MADTLSDLQRMLLTIGGAIGPSSAEAAPRKSYSQTTQITPYQQEQLAIQKENAMAQNALRQQQAEAQAQKMAKEQESTQAREALIRNLSVMSQPTMGPGGQSVAYDVPQELQGQLGEKYLTNMILPSAQTPIAQRNIADEGQRVTPDMIEGGVQMTPPDKVDWQRLVAGNFDRAYSTGQPQEQAAATEPTYEDTVKMALETGAISPEKFLDLTKPKEKSEPPLLVEAKAAFPNLPVSEAIKQFKELGARNSNADAKFGMQLRKEFNSLQPVKDYRDIQSRYNVMEKALEESRTSNNMVAVDQAIITLYNKMTDPQSVVRESEYVRTPQDMAWMNRAKAGMQRVAKGGRLDPESREAMMVMAKKFKGAYDQQYNSLADEWKGYAAQSGIDPSMISNKKAGESSAPSSGRFTIKEIP